MKKVIFYIDSMAPSGGIERVVSVLLSKFSDDFHITLLTKDKLDSFYDIPTNVKRISLNLNLIKPKLRRSSRVLQVIMGFFKEVIKLRRFHKENNYDYFYCTHPLAVLAFKISGGRNEKLVISEHGSYFGFNKFYRLIKSLTYKSCHAYIVPTSRDSEYYHGLNIKNIHIPHFRPNLNYKLTDSCNKTVLNVGRLTDDKQQIILLEIWADILRENQALSDWKLHIIGSGENKNLLESKIRFLNIQDSVSIIKPTRNIEIYYLSSSIFALTSRYEGFGMVLVEAMSFGLPVISFDCPSGPEDIINDSNGILVKNFEKDNYRSCLEVLMSNETQRSSLSRTAFAEGERWGNDSLKEKWLGVFR